jgi:hypothetical protein
MLPVKFPTSSWNDTTDDAVSLLTNRFAVLGAAGDGIENCDMAIHIPQRRNRKRTALMLIQRWVWSLWNSEASISFPVYNYNI